MKILVHVCCAVCAGGVIDQIKDKYNITCYFYNPNIHPQEEYERRLLDVYKHCAKLDISLIHGEYDKNEWLGLVKGLESEPEGGQRCLKCYTMRLEQTAKIAKDRGFDIFASTLTISPHKKAEIINPIGQKLSEKYGVKFLEADFKKHDGFKCACDIAKSENFYRQNYCGCVYSQNT